MSARYSTWALLALLATSAAPAMHARGAAPQAAPAAPAAFTILVNGTPVGREEVAVQTDASGTTITSRARLSAPLSSVVELAELRYGADWAPQSFLLEATLPTGPVSSRTTFTEGRAVTEGASAGAAISVSHEVPPRAIILPNGVFGAYHALAVRLAGASAGTELQAYVVPTAPIGVRVASVHDERMQTGTTLFDVRRYDLTLRNPGGDLTVHLTTSADNSLLRVTIPDQAIDVVRTDLVRATARTLVHSNPGDEAVFIPAEGFNLGATITRPSAGLDRRPAVILLADAEVYDRDGFAMGVPAIGQLAGTLADAGFLVVRFDKRGHQQSGGRSESATIDDHAGDVRAIIRWLRSRRDVDGDRIALVGHGEGAWVGLLATSRERRVSAVVSIAGPSTKGTELVLEQQQRSLDRLNLPSGERQGRIDLQRKIQDAVLSGKGWDAIPPEMRRAADTPWFQSVLAFDPEKVVDGIRQPILIVHPELDQQVPVAHADRLAAMARRSRAVELVIVRGVGHELVPVVAGEAGEPATPVNGTISGDVSGTVGDWLVKTLAAR